MAGLHIKSAMAFVFPIDHRPLITSLFCISSDDFRHAVLQRVGHPVVHGADADAAALDPVHGHQGVAAFAGRKRRRTARVLAV